MIKDRSRPTPSGLTDLATLEVGSDQAELVRRAGHVLVGLVEKSRTNGRSLDELVFFIADWSERAGRAFMIAQGSSPDAQPLNPVVGFSATLAEVPGIFAADPLHTDEEKALFVQHALREPPASYVRFCAYRYGRWLIGALPTDQAELVGQWADA